MTKKDDNAQESYELVSGQHGGYWRHAFTDHNYLYNLYYPPADFFSHITKHIKQLVLSYPGGQSEMAGLVGKLIDQPAANIVVGNGAAELIKIIAGLGRKMIVPVPSFNEYANAMPAGDVVEFALAAPSFQLDVAKFAEAAINSKAELAVVVSPNNPTSLLVPKTQLVWLANKLAEHGCMLIVDESFIDFAKNRAQETLEPEIEKYPNLAIFKSMSKAYGICGIRIGYMLSANLEFAAEVRQGLHIWNLNGFAEEFLRLAPQYQQEFKDSCNKVQADRDLFYEQLQTIPGMIVYKPDANYIFCRLPEHAPSGPIITEKLFVEHNIYIKHCQGKTMPESDRYLRIASRTQDENTRLVATLHNLVGLAETK
ncbi:MAG: histidinol-phosphate aminotransferase family protein [Desulfobulbaceae bacterium]|nr:histidinol-phosphate aminotransferase family protein [Desulfobulbaceae bacterium]HIJ78548.1 histidinol-phosphate aminotransferase family protein [Deltaproteobacteria bacterium]